MFSTPSGTEKFLSELKAVDCGNIRTFNGVEYKDQQGKASLPEGIKATDDFIKDYINKNGGEVDYIHGESNLEKLVCQNIDSVGIYFEKMNKSELFKYVSKNGALPRKTFSMGEGVEKRYYLEGRKITKA